MSSQQLTRGNKRNSAKPETRELSRIRLSVYVFSQVSGLLSAQLLHTASISLRQKDPYNFSQDIKAKDLSGTLCITWTPSDVQAPGPKTEKPSSKSLTSST